MRSLLLLGMASLFGADAAQAQDVSARASVSPGQTVGVGQMFTLNVSVDGTQTLDAQPAPPQLSFAQYLGSGTQTNMQMGGGRTTVTLTIQFRFQALTEGTFEIPAIEVAAQGEQLRTEPVQLTISATAPAPSGGTQAGQVGPNDLFLTAQASKSSVIPGESIIVDYLIWAAVDVSNYNFTRVPEPAGFWVEDFTPAGQPQVEQVTRNGRQYIRALIRRVAMVPTSPGSKTIEPVGIEAQVRTRSGDPFDIFGRGGLFGSRVPVSVLSNSLEIEVRPLPPGQPSPFSGIVGSLDIQSSIDRDSVSTNEALTLTVRMSGTGNVRSLQAPVLDLPGDFEVYPPEVSETSRLGAAGLAGERTFEYVLIPRAPGQRVIPEISLGYWDAGAGSYRTARAPSIPLTVTGAPVADRSSPVSRSGVSELRRDIRFIHLGEADLRPSGRNVFSSATFWLLLLLPLGAMAGAPFARRHFDLLEGDVAYARGRRAGRVARQRLARANELVAGGEERAVYAEVDRALRGLVGDRLNVAESGLQTAELTARVSERGVSDATTAELKACLEHCDLKRFAPPATDPDEVRRFLERAGDLMTALDTEIGR